MSQYDVAVVLEGADLDDDALVVRLFEALPDALPSTINGVTQVVSPVVADDPESAAMWLIQRLGELWPAARPVRLDQDLVSITDIADRTGRTRESIRLLADGLRGPGGFPSHVGVVGDRVRVWPWALVVDWFREALGFDLGERGIRPEIAAAVDAWLAGTSITHRRAQLMPPAVQPNRRRSA
jgi:hypothetical protein